MAKDVFICYASQDQAVAEDVCSKLEGTGIRCWIAPRDVPAGKWGGAIMEAVAQSRIMVLIFSTNSNSSANCLSEVHAAFSKNIKIIPLRIDDTVPSEDMEYYLQTFHWLDARVPPLEKHLQGLTARVKADLAQAAAQEKARQEAEAARKKAEREAEEARKAQEAEAAKEEARREVKKGAEAIAREEPTAVEVPSQARPVSLAAGIVLSIAGLVAAWIATLIWKAGLFGAPRQDEPWYILFALILLWGLPGVIPGLYLLRRGITGYLQARPATGKVANWWWLPSIVLGFLGGIISWFKHKEINWRKAMNMLTAGILFTLMFTIPVLATEQETPIGPSATPPVPPEIQEAPPPTPAPAPEPAKAPAPVPPSAPAQLHYFGGHIRESGTNVPIADAKIEVYDYEYTSDPLNNPKILHGAATTDSKGYYQTSPIDPPGPYAIQVTASGYHSEWFENTYDMAEAGPVILHATNEITIIDLTLERMESISGRVIADADGKPIANVHIIAEDYVSNIWMAGTDAGDDGTYTLFVPKAGTYRVRAVPSHKKMPYADEFYNNTHDMWDALPVTVNPGQGTPGIDFSLAPGGSVSGTVRNADGSAPLADVSVECCIVIDGRQKGCFGATTDSQGNYTIYGMPYGNFIVKAPGGGRWGSNDDDLVQEFYSEQFRQQQAATITVSENNNPAGIDFTLTTGGSISGKVISEVTFETIAYVLVHAGDFTTGEVLSSTFTRSDGTYTLHGLPTGTYLVRAVPSHKNMPYVDEYYDNTNDRNRAKRVEVKLGQDTPGINFSLAPE